ncbi:hypothetical protein [Erwinia mallotivora]|uniref:hypothetical protein n=1 Tax=Erwinia mallotivora TaxID=69222 RepID=UPI0021C0B42B|nr:hypothetical protein [Erwinia mallotivora]
MKICVIGKFEVKVLTRNEHCPPHVHVFFDKGEMRLEFSFVHNDFEVYDTKPIKNEPLEKEIDNLITALKKKEILDMIRMCWDKIGIGTCLENKYWDLKKKLW